MGHRTFFSCERCGSFGAETIMFEQLANLPQNVRRSLISNLADIPQVRYADTPVISAEEIEKAQTRTIRVGEMADRLLNYCVRHGESMRHEYSYENIDVIKSCYAFDNEEVLTLVEYLSGLGFARPSSGTFRISPSGYLSIFARGAQQKLRFATSFHCHVVCP
jgi:hypothetical protein